MQYLNLLIKNGLAERMEGENRSLQDPGTRGRECRARTFWELGLLRRTIIASETLFNFIKAYILKEYGVKGKDGAIFLKRDLKILQEISFDRPKEIFGIFNILDIGAMEVEESLEYVSRYALLTNDALNAAAMKVNKITSIATNDKDFERLAGVKIWAPL